MYNRNNNVTYTYTLQGIAYSDIALVDISFSLFNNYRSYNAGIQLFDISNIRFKTYQSNYVVNTSAVGTGLITPYLLSATGINKIYDQTSINTY